MEETRSVEGEPIVARPEPWIAPRGHRALHCSGPCRACVCAGRPHTAAHGRCGSDTPASGCRAVCKGYFSTLLKVFPEHIFYDCLSYSKLGYFCVVSYYVLLSFLK